MSGWFISFEGAEGVGKSTQVKLLADHLLGLGRHVTVTREPGGSAGAEAIRQLLLSGSADRWSTRTEALLFAAARSDHLEKVILPARDRGDIILCDRFVDSSRIYQGSLPGGIGDDAILQLHALGSDGILPDRTVVLTLPADLAASRVAARGGDDRIGHRALAAHTAMQARFEALAKTEPNRIRLVDASGSVDAVHGSILSVLGLS